MCVSTVLMRFVMSCFDQVLEVDITKDDKGKRVPEYFIHFNGWNRR